MARLEKQQDMLGRPAGWGGMSGANRRGQRLHGKDVEQRSR